MDDRSPQGAPGPSQDPESLPQDPHAPRPPAFAFLRPAESPDQIGRLGGFHMLRLLGEGGMGMVFLADDPRLGRKVAVKVLKPQVAILEENRRRFLREARAAAAVRHAHVCPIYDVGEDNGAPFVVMAYIEGQSLAARLAEGRRFNDCREAVRLIRQAADGLVDVHEAGIVHRDLKPGNILLDAIGRPVLADFGLARPQNDPDPLTTEGAILGTPAYMAPEQASQSIGDIGPRTDLYSLAVVLYRMVTGRLPFEAPVALLPFRIVLDEPVAPSKHRPDLDPALEAIICKGMAKWPENRYPTAEAFIQALDVWLTKEGPPAFPRDHRQWHRLSRLGVFGLIAAAGVLLAGICVLAYLLWFRAASSGNGSPPAAPPTPNKQAGPAVSLGKYGGIESDSTGAKHVAG